MKVVFIIGGPAPYPGAAWARINAFAESAVQQGFDVDVLSTWSFKSKRKISTITEDTYSINSWIPNIGLFHPVFFLLNFLMSFFFSLFFIIIRKPRFVVVSLPGGDTGLGAVSASLMTRRALIIDHRDEWDEFAIRLSKNRPSNQFYQQIHLIMPFLYNKCCFVAVTTERLRTNLMMQGVGNVITIPNGAMLATFRPKERYNTNRGLRIFYSGGVGGYYRLDIVVQALHRLDPELKQRVKLVIASPSDVTALLHYARKLGLAEQIENKGAVIAKDELCSIMQECDVGIIPYDSNPLWDNSLPAKFFEYCASGLPVVAMTRSTSLLAELTDANSIGLTTPPMDYESLANSIEWLAKRPEYLESAGKRARLLVESQFNRQVLAGKFVSHLNSLCYENI